MGNWNAHSFADWTLGTYMLALAYPALCYVSATILIPADASQEMDWHAYYDRVRRPLFAAILAGGGVHTAMIVVFGRVALFDPAIFVSVAFTLAYIVAFASEKERVHEVVVVANLLLVLAGYAPLIYDPVGG